MTDATNTQSLLDALDIEGLAPEEQEELLLELNALIFKGSLVRLIERMDDATKDAFNTLMDTDPSEDQVLDFLNQNVPDADKAVEETVQELRDDILAVAG